jgi:hypothetical protein
MISSAGASVCSHSKLVTIRSNSVRSAITLTWLATRRSIIGWIASSSACRRQRTRRGVWVALGTDALVGPDDPCQAPSPPAARSF